MRTRRRMRCLLAQCARRTRCVAGRENASNFIAACARHARARATFSPKNGAARGFTLVEVLVALAIMALMAVMTWRGIDGMARAQQATHEHTDGVLALQAGLGQWRADLDAMMVWPLPSTAVDPANAAAQTNSPAATRSLAWDGSVLRLTRASSRAPGDGVRVVAWARRPTGEWLRWQSAPVSAQNAWASAWEAAARWGQAGAPLLPPGAPAQAVQIGRLTDWQLHYYRNNAWTNPLSSAAEAVAGGGSSTNSAVPDAIRLMLTLAPSQPLAGALQVDWVRPTLGGGS